MKKIIMFLATFSIALSSIAQNYQKVPDGLDIKSLKGQMIKFDIEDWTDLGHNLYDHVPTIPSESPVYQPMNTIDGDGFTDTNSVVNRKFLIIDIFTKVLGSSGEKTILQIEDTSKHETLYFVSASDYASNFPFDVKSTDKSLSTSSDLERKVDDIGGEIDINTPQGHWMVNKIIKKGIESYYLTLEAYGSTLNVSEKGVIVLFKDGTKWIKNEAEIDEEIDQYSNNAEWIYSCFIRLTKKDLDLFSTKEISKYRLYIYDSIDDTRTIPSSEDATKFKMDVLEIIKAK